MSVKSDQELSQALLKARGIEPPPEPSGVTITLHRDDAFDGVTFPVSDSLFAVDGSGHGFTAVSGSGGPEPIEGMLRVDPYGGDTIEVYRRGSWDFIGTVGALKP